MLARSAWKPVLAAHHMARELATFFFLVTVASVIGLISVIV
jgi:hypothetical protein